MEQAFFKWIRGIIRFGMNVPEQNWSKFWVVVVVEGPAKEFV